MSNNQITLPDGLDVETATDVLREFARTDDAQIIENETLENLRAEIKDAKEAFAAVLAEESPQSADTLARQDMDALTEPFRDDDGSIDVDTLRQTPETGDVAPSDGGNETPEDEVSLDSLSLDERQQIRDVDLPKIQSFEQRGMAARVDALKQGVAEKVGAESYEDIETELEAL